MGVEHSVKDHASDLIDFCARKRDNRGTIVFGIVEAGLEACLYWTDVKLQVGHGSLSEPIRMSFT